MTELLRDAAAGTVGVAFDTKSAYTPIYPCQVVVTAANGGSGVIVQVSGSASQDDWRTLATVTADAGPYAITGPFERIRAVASGGNASTVSAYLQTSA